MADNSCDTPNTNKAKRRRSSVAHTLRVAKKAGLGVAAIKHTPDGTVLEADGLTLLPDACMAHIDEPSAEKAGADMCRDTAMPAEAGKLVRLEPRYSLKQAIEKFFPNGPLTAASLRTEIRKGRLRPTRVAGKDLVTEADIAEMLERCAWPTPARVLVSTSDAAKAASQRGPSLTSRLKSAQAAANAIAQELRKPSPNISPKNTRPPVPLRGGDGELPQGARYRLAIEGMDWLHGRADTDLVGRQDPSRRKRQELSRLCDVAHGPAASARQASQAHQ